MALRQLIIGKKLEALREKLAGEILRGEEIATRREAMQKREEELAAAIDEVSEKYGFPTSAIVTMDEVIGYLHNQERGGRVVIDDDVKAALDAYYEQYGARG